MNRTLPVLFILLAVLFFLPTCSLNSFRPMATVSVMLASPKLNGRRDTFPKCAAFTFTSPTTANTLSSGQLNGYSPDCLEIKGIVSTAVSKEAAQAGFQLTLPVGDYDVTPIGIDTPFDCTSLPQLFAAGIPGIYVAGVPVSFSTSQGTLKITSNYGPGTPEKSAGCVPVDSINAIAAGNNTTCASKGGTAYCWGYNSRGQVGNGSTVNAAAPTPVAGLISGVTAMATGSYAGHSCAVVNGAVRCWGANTYGQLGNGGTADSSTPVSVSGILTGATQVTVGSYAGHTCAVISGGVMKCWGENGLGQLGDGTFVDKSIPTNISGLASPVTAMLTGSVYGHTCALQGNGVSCWGNNASGQLGDNSTTASEFPIQPLGLASGVTGLASGSSSAQSCAMTAGLGVVCWGDGQLVPGQVTGLQTGVTAVALGGGFACAIQGGALLCWGNNANGQLGNNSTSAAANPVQVFGMTSGVTAVTAGSAHTCAVKNGAMYCWGKNDYGQLAILPGADVLTPLQVNFPVY